MDMSTTADHWKIQTRLGRSKIVQGTGATFKACIHIKQKDYDLPKANRDQVIKPINFELSQSEIEGRVDRQRQETSRAVLRRAPQKSFDF